MTIAKITRHQKIRIDKLENINEIILESNFIPKMNFNHRFFLNIYVFYRNDFQFITIIGIYVLSCRTKVLNFACFLSLPPSHFSIM